MKITTVGLDLAKQVFQGHGGDECDKVVLRKQLRRREVLSFFANLPPCLVGLEACGGAPYWARELQKLGHDVRLMAVAMIHPYRTNQKNDANDAEAICEAVSRPHLRFVPLKTVESQDIQAIHRMRSRLVKGNRTAVVREIVEHAV